MAGEREQHGHPVKSPAGKVLLEPDACEEVARHFPRQCRRARRPLSLRLLVNSHHDRLPGV
jgi:hypothetical protein